MGSRGAACCALIFLRLSRSERPEPVEGCGQHSESDSAYFVTFVPFVVARSPYCLLPIAYCLSICLVYSFQSLTPSSKSEITTR